MTDVRTPPGRLRALYGTAGSQLLVLTLWFSASAVAPQLSDEWRLGEGAATGLTLAVQIGFVVGALGFAVAAVPDIVPSRRLFAITGLGGAGANAALVLLDAGDYGIAFALRLVTGIALAGVYPSGLKVMAGWFRRGRGMALGVLVGALTVGSAGPHLIRGLGLEWRGVILGASFLAVAGVVVMVVVVTDGPFETRRTMFSLRHLRAIVSNRGV
ncbi:MAG: MFS transporter, partial [Acidimicrobiia bacterium]